MEPEYTLLTGESYNKAMELINERGDHFKALSFNSAQIFKLDNKYLIAPPDYENQYSIVTKNEMLMKKWIQEEKFPAPFVKGKTFHFELSDVEDLNSKNDSLAKAFLRLLNMDTVNTHWDKAQIAFLEQRMNHFGKSKVYNKYMLEFSAVLVSILREREIVPVWYIEKADVALNPVYAPICIDANSDADLRIENLLYDYLKGRLKDLDFQLNMMIRFKKQYVRASRYKTFEVRKCK